MGPSTVSFAEKLLCKLGAALLFAIMLAMVTNASLVQGLRFISAICLLTSSWHFGVALVRRRPLSGLSEWSEAAIFSLIAGCAHLFVKQSESSSAQLPVLPHQRVDGFASDTTPALRASVPSRRKRFDASATSFLEYYYFYIF